jgi:short-subunit dehydrogenase
MQRETALITGASAGIGQELATLFAADGSNLVLVARRTARLEKLAVALRQSHGVDVDVRTVDLAEAGAPQVLFDQLDAEGIRVDVLVNNAGFGALGRFAELPVERTLDMLQVNLTALTHLTRLFLPEMLRRRQGGILNLASTAAFQAGPHMAVYYATKSYILHFSEALAEEVRGTGVSVSCLCPGPTHTEFQAVAGMENSPIFRMGPMEARAVAEMGYRGFRRRKAVIISGWRNWLGAFAVRFAPRKFVRRVVLGLNRLGPLAAITEPVENATGPRESGP